MRHKLSWLFLLGLSCFYLRADTITIGGLITQSTPDGTGPASNNPTLNNIIDSEAYNLTLQFAGSITEPGMYGLSGASLSFDVPTAPASETDFDSVSLTITPDSGNYDLSLSACLTTGSGCYEGNELSAGFSIPATGLNATNVAATGQDQPHPFELLEDDGETDLQGAISTYSGTPVTSTSPVPEPGYSLLSGLLLLAMAGPFAFRSRRFIT